MTELAPLPSLIFEYVSSFEVLVCLFTQADRKLCQCYVLPLVFRFTLPAMDMSPVVAIYAEFV